MAQNTFERLEKKLLISNDKVPEFIEKITPYMNPDEYNKNGQPYMICNLYFDNDNDDVIRTSVMKPKYKEKLRLRSYGVPNSDSTVFIELKKKLNGVGTKRRAKLTLAEAESYIHTGVHPQKLKYIDEQVLREIDYFIKVNKVYPKVYISYMRNAYFGKDDSNFRITIDRDIVTRRYDLSLQSGCYGDSLLPQGKTLLEIKFEGVVPLWFSKIFNELGLSFGTYSKYGSEFNEYKKNQVIGLLNTQPKTEVSVQ